MKRISKFFMAALAATALASCSDDLSLGSNPNLESNQVQASLPAMNDEMTRAGVLENYEGGKAWTWTENDQIRLFTLASLTYHNYGLVSGEGTTTGKFQKIGDTEALSDDTQKYAVTEAANVYAVSASPSGNARVTMTLDGTCEVSRKDIETGTLYKFPVPLWGEASDDTENLSVDFKHLMSYIRIDLAELPLGTQAIVLTTHGIPYEVEGGALNHGYQLVDEITSDDQAFWNTIPYIYGGECDALSGTLDADLVPGASLQVNKVLVHSDTLRVNLDDVEDQVFFVPVPVGTYKKLDVLAVSEDSRYAYAWAGTLLKSYKNEEFKLGVVKNLRMNLVEAGTIDMNSLNQMIAAYNLQAKRTTIINIDELVDDDGAGDDDDDFAFDRIQVAGDGNLVLNIAALSGSYGTLASPYVITDEEDEAIVSSRTVTINEPGIGNKYFTAELPTYKLVIGTMDGANGNSVWKVFGSANKFVSGLELVANNAADVTEGVFRNETGAAITVKNGIQTLIVMEPTMGDVYVCSSEEETEITGSIRIRGTSDNDIRIDDALVNKIRIKEGAHAHHIFTTGSAAMKSVEDFDVATLLPDQTTTQSFYTGAGLSDYAWANGYDFGTIYTVAQLQSMGESGATQRPAGLTNPTATKTYAMWDRVELFWLGSHQYQWVGPVVDMADFSFDGKNKRLMNMVLRTTLGGNDIYVDDPHYCCTSCGRPNLAGNDLIQLENLGLIRSIIETGDATVKNVNLNDVMLITDAEIDGIGSIVGLIDVDGDLTFENNKVGEVKIDVNGDFVGGMVGYAEAAGMSIMNNINDSRKNDAGYIISDKSYVGGLFGQVVAENAIYANNNQVTMSNNEGIIEAGESFAAGLFGQFTAKAASVIYKSTVDLKTISAGVAFAGGLAGQSYMYGTDLTIGNGNDGEETKVKAATVIEATEGFVGGLLGQSTKTNTLRVGVTATGDNKTRTITVDVAKLAGSQSVAGLVGNNTTSTLKTIINAETNGKKNSVIKVTVTTYENTYAETDPDHWVNSSSDRILYGTFQDVIGYMEADVDVLDKNLTKSAKLTDELKETVLYKLHQDYGHDTTTGEYYWGDNKGNIGYGRTGVYMLNNTEITGEQLDGYNHYKVY